MNGMLATPLTASDCASRLRAPGDVIEISLLLPASQAEALLTTAQARGVSLAQMMRQMVRDHLSGAAQSQC